MVLTFLIVITGAMEHMNQMDELLTRKILNELNEEEEALVAAWVSTSEENRNYYEALKSTWQLANLPKSAGTIDVEEEWSQFRKSVDQPVSRRSVYQLMKPLVAAAAVIGIIGLLWYWWTPTTPGDKPVVLQNIPASKPLARVERNTSGKPVLYKLQDGSEVLLHDQSELSWQEPFSADWRNLNLKGAAEFKVAKDSKRPFVVSSEIMSVTAIGTKFLVTDAEKAGHIIVRLYEGQVFVNFASRSDPVLSQDFFLRPGQELLYGYRKRTVLVRKFGQSNATAQAKTNYNSKQHRDNPNIPQNDKGSWYMFNNQSLKQVFDQLKKMYGVEIIYPESDIQKMYFIGKFNKTDSIGVILKQICTLNDLILTKENYNRFIITK